jgi:hypothetical protein
VTQIDEKLSREETAAVVCEALNRAGISVVLTGGAVVSIYSANEYESFDLDFVQPGLARHVDNVMNRLGFEKSGRHWRHPNSPLWVEFPSGPVAVGDSVVTEFAELRTAAGVLRLLTPTDCVMDRLAAFYHWDDLQCLEQALSVACHHPIDLQRVRRWSHKESAAAKFEVFAERLGRMRR